MSTSFAAAPDAGHHLPGQPVAELHDLARCVLVVASVPGAGKTTLLRRLFATAGDESLPIVTGDGVRILDSEQSRSAYW